MDSKPKLAVILNPVSGKGLAVETWSKVAPNASASYDVTVFKTERAGHAIQLTQQAINEGNLMLVAVGGDGTLSEVVNGYILANGKDLGAAIGVLHCGTGGDYIKTMEIPQKTSDAWNIIVNGKTVEVDAGKLVSTPYGTADSAERYFINIASFGLSANLIKKLSDAPKIVHSILGSLKYKAYVVYCHAAVKQPSIKITIQDSPSNPPTSTTIEKLYIMTIGNGKYFGNGMKVLRDSDPSDGLFNCLTVQDPTNAEFLLHADRGLKLGDFHERVPSKASVCMGVKVIAEPVNGESNVWIEADGEVAGVLPAQFSVLPRAVRLFVL
ncbi:UNVERIFIED_CONTAM: hypothetical protein HDU68_001587 [Siphonaria sp. JEL0065]|nr:hypothetical protein HDU68_001587 [Siphonaria sp. JEL0065]